MRGLCLVVLALVGHVIVGAPQTKACDVALNATCSSATAVQLQSHAVAVQAVPLVVQSAIPVQQQVVVQQHAVAVQALAAPVVIQQHCVQGFARSAVRVRNIQRVRPQRVRSFSLQRTVVR